MTAREQIIEAMAKAAFGDVWDEEYYCEAIEKALDAIPLALLWDWFIETGRVVRTVGYEDEEPVFRLVPE